MGTPEKRLSRATSDRDGSMTERNLCAAASCVDRKARRRVDGPIQRATERMRWNDIRVVVCAAGFGLSRPDNLTGWGSATAWIAGNITEHCFTPPPSSRKHPSRSRAGRRNIVVASFAPPAAHRSSAGPAMRSRSALARSTTPTSSGRLMNCGRSVGRHGSRISRCFVATGAIARPTRVLRNSLRRPTTASGPPFR